MNYFKHIVICLTFFQALSAFSQGVYNNGAHIVFSGAVSIYIDNNSNGNYLSQTNGIIDPSATGTLILKGNWTNNAGNTGFSSDNGLTVFNGANQSISGSSSTTFFNLSLDGSGTKTQNLNTSVGGVSTTTGTFAIGNVIYDLNSNTLTVTNGLTNAITVGSGYILSETNSAVNPSVLRWNMGTNTGAHIIPFGVGGTQIPFTFNKITAGASNIDVSTRSTSSSDNTPWAGTSNVSGVSFFYCPNNSLSGNPCAVNSVIDRWWDITPSSAVTANITLSYRGSENTLNVPYNTGQVGIQWWDGSAWNLDNSVSGSALAVTSGVGSVSANNLSQFCPFVISSLSVPLPVEISEMDVKCVSKGNLISWTTASENNSDFFIIEKSSNGIDFIDIAHVNAAGNSKNNLNYSYIDNNLSENTQTLVYYRIKEVDIYGNVKKYKILQSSNCKTTESTINITNTINGEVFITINSAMPSSYTIQLYNLLGQPVLTEQFSVNKGLNKSKLDTHYLLQSVYMISVEGNGIIKNQKVVISN